MEKHRLLLTFCMMLIYLQPMQSQLSPLYLDSLKYYLESKNPMDHHKKIAKIISNTDETQIDLLVNKQLNPLLNTIAMRKGNSKFLREVYMRIGQKYKQLNKVEESIKYFLIAHHHVEDKFCLDANAWFVENPLAIAYTKLDDHENALYYSILVENSLLFNHNDENLSRSYNNRAITHKTLNQLSLAEQYYKQGLYISFKNKYYQGMFPNYIGLAEVAILNDSLQLAKYYLQAAKSIIDSTPRIKHDENLNSYCITKANLQSHEGRYYDAISTLIAACGYYTDTLNNREYAKYCNEISKLYLNLNDTLHCAHYLNKGFKAIINSFATIHTSIDKQNLHHENTLSELFLTCSQLFDHNFKKNHKLYDLKKSLYYLELGLYGYHIIQINILNDASKLQIIKQTRKLADNAIRNLWQWYKIDPNDTRIWYYIRFFFDHTKALLLQEKNLNANKYLYLNKIDKKIIESLEDYEFKIKHESKGMNSDRDLYFIQKMNIQRLKHTIFKKYKVSTNQASTPSNYLEYHVQDSGVYLLSSMNGNIHFDSLGSLAEYNFFYLQFSNYILKKNNASKIATHDLYNFLIPSDIILSSEFSIIPDGTVQFIPFEALQDKENKTLLLNHTLSYRHQYHEQQLNYNFSNKSIGIYALCPQYKENIAIDKKNTTNRGNIPPLIYTNEEAKAIKNIYQDITKIDSTIELNTLIHRIKNAQVVHYAGHAYLNGDDATLLLDANGTRLSMEDIQDMYNPLRMVVLSACETGLGKWDYGEGIRSLGKSFRESGSQSVIMSLWSVNDHSSECIMRYFYEGLKSGLTKDKAMHEAKIKYLEQSDLDKRHPFYWAGFTVYGDCTKLKFAATWQQYILICGLMLIIILSIIKLTKKFYYEKKFY